MSKNLSISFTPGPKKLCPLCDKEQHGVRCEDDQTYLVTQEAYLSAQGDKMLGQELGGRYGVIERLGMGGMGAVYKAIDPDKNQTVAVKVLREAYAQHPAIRERFIREAEAGASIDHPNVVPLIDFGIEQDRRLWLAMEFVEGWTLRDEINHNGAFTITEAIELLKQILRGLAVAHDAGLIHRDLKHDNIMYHGRRENFVARIVDFGVVKSAAADLDRQRNRSKVGSIRKANRADDQGAFDLSDEFLDDDLNSSNDSQSSSAEEETNEDLALGGAALTAAGMMVGSPSYMAPEQIRGLKVGPPADLYALAVVTYEILAARRLFTVNNYEVLLKEGAQREAPRLVFSARGEIIPESLTDLIHTALAHDPLDRYPDAHTMLLALDQMNFTESVLPPDLFCTLPHQRIDMVAQPQAQSNKPALRIKLEVKEEDHSSEDLIQQPENHESPDLSKGVSPHPPPSQLDQPKLISSEHSGSTSSSSQSSRSPIYYLLWACPFVVGLMTWLTARWLH